MAVMCFDAAYRQDQAAKGDLAGHGCVTAGLQPTVKRCEGGSHSKAGRRTVHRDCASRNMDMDSSRRNFEMEFLTMEMQITGCRYD